MEHRFYFRIYLSYIQNLIERNPLLNSSQFCQLWLNPYKDSNSNLSIKIENELIGYQLQFDKISDAILEMTENKPIYSQTRLNTNEDKQRLQYLESKIQTIESEVCFDPLLWNMTSMCWIMHVDLFLIHLWAIFDVDFYLANKNSPNNGLIYTLRNCHKLC